MMLQMVSLLPDLKALAEESHQFSGPNKMSYVDLVNEVGPGPGPGPIPK